jgi:hypothetical protein
MNIFEGRAVYHTIESILPEWLGYAFRQDPDTIPDDFDIPHGVPQQPLTRHRCAESGTR